MSKAFTREEDTDLVRPTLFAPRPSLPVGAKNYLTPEGAGRLKAELAQLEGEQRPALAALPAEDPERSALSRVDQRIHQLKTCLRSAIIVESPGEKPDRVTFGSYVSVRDPDGEQSRYRIVGADEADPSRGWISWVSPLAKALKDAQPGQLVQFRTPAGPQELEVIAISQAADI